jgi:hypothetical protein
MSLLNKILSTSFLRNAMYAVLAVMVVLNVFFISSPHPHFEAERIPGFWAIFGAGVAIALAKLAKGAAHTFLGKDLDFYEKHEK